MSENSSDGQSPDRHSPDSHAAADSHAADRQSPNSPSSVHVIYIITKLELGGAQKVCLTLLKGINHNGTSSSLISGAEGVLVSEVKNLDSKNHNSTNQDSIFLLDSLKREVGLKILFSELAAFIKIIKKIRELKKKYVKVVVHTHSTKAGLIGRWAAFFAGVKTRVHTVHGFGFHDHQSRLAWYITFFLEYITSLITTHYVCVSLADQNIGIKYFPRFAKKSSIIRAAVDWDKFYIPATKIESNSNKKFIFGTVSCLKPQKNLLDLLQAFKYVIDSISEEQKNSVSLEIIGDGMEREKLESWVTKNNMQNYVSFLGWQNDVSKWMVNWSGYVMSSLWEGLPCSIVEARLSHLPVITYNIAGIPEVIKNKKNGFLVKPKDWNTLGKKMLSLFRNRNLQNHMQLYADDLSEFKNSSMVQKHVELYKNLI